MNLDRIDWQPGATLVACAVTAIGMLGSVAVLVAVALGVRAGGWWVIAGVLAGFLALYWSGSAALAAVRRQRRQEAHELGLMDPLPQHRTYEKFGRNESCPCGSGRKVKHCHVELSR